jgi:hypothetical protein
VGAVFWFLAVAAACWCDFVRVQAPTVPPPSFTVAVFPAVALACSLLLHSTAGVQSNWDTVKLQGDSHEYYAPKSAAPAVRPPVYPLFIELAVIGTAFSHEVVPVTTVQVRKPAGAGDLDALRRVARLQKLLFFVAAALLGAFLMRATGSSLPFMFILWLYCRGFFPGLDNILSEPLALVWLVLLAGLTLLVLRSFRPVPLVAAGAVFGLLFLTRSAGIFAGVFLLVAMAAWFVHYNGPSRYRTSFASLLACGLVVATGMAFTHQGVGSRGVSGKDGLQLVGKALPLAAREDAEMFADEFSRTFLDQALDRRDQVMKDLSATYKGDPRMIMKERGTALIYTVALPLLCELDTSLTAAQQQAFLASWSRRLLWKHRGQYLQATFWYFRDLIQGGPLGAWFPGGAWLAIAASLAIAVWCRGWWAVFGVTCALAHVAHMMLMASFETSARRYAAFTEWLIPLGLLVMALGVLQNRWPHSRHV